jgi:hypothetical protein
MESTRPWEMLGGIVGVALLGMISAAVADTVHYEVTITNLTRGQTFTPILVASHRAGLTLFRLGAPASPQLAILAEEGDTGPLTALLQARPKVKEVTNSGGLLPPGASTTVLVQAPGRFNHLSVAAMLIPTNDGFFALNGVQGPDGNDVLTLFSSRL